MSRLHPISGCDDKNRKADVIFVHGLGGDPFATWSADENSSWPRWLGAQVPEVGVWSLGYAASPSRWLRFLPAWAFRFFGLDKSRDTGYSMPLPRRAKQVLDLMQLQGFGARPIFFVCHSLGGLLVKQLLRASLDADGDHRRVAERTRAVLFLATPHSGASLASLLHLFRLVFGSTVSLEDLRAHDAHLGDLYDVYRNRSSQLGISTRTYYEQRGVGAGLLTIVNPTSAHPGVGDDPIGLDEDHLSIAKPRSRDAQVCLAALDLLRKHVLAAAPPPTKPTPPAVEPLRPAAPAPRAPAFQNAPIPCQLPPAAETFFGRVEELETLVARLYAGKSTAVVGPGGLGKTALAAEALRRVVGERGDRLAASPYPDGIVYLDLYAWHAKAELAFNTLASTLAGAEFRDSLPARERAAEACRGRRFLLIVEGGEAANGEEGRAGIGDLFAVLAAENRWLLLTRNGHQALPAETLKLHDALEPPAAEDLLASLTGTQLSGPLRDRVLVLFQGHPLALTWAGNLLARGEEPARLLVEDWEKDPLLELNDPKNAELRLRSLFESGVRDFDEATRQVLEAAGLLAHAPFPFEFIAAVVSPDEARDGLRLLVQRGFLRLIDNEERWQFGHVLAYRFARVDSGSDPLLREGLATALERSLDAALCPGGDLPPVATTLDHAAALLRSDDDARLWSSLAVSLLYQTVDRLTDLGQLALVERGLAAVRGWLERLPEDTAQNTIWRRELSVLLTHEGDLRRAQGRLAAALDAYRKSLEIRQQLMTLPAIAQAQSDLATSLNKVGEVLKEQGNLDAALGAHQQALALAQELANAEPDNAEWQKKLAVAQIRIGTILKDQGKLDLAFESFQKALDLNRRRVAAEPASSDKQRDYSVTLHKLGDILKAQGHLDEAIVAYRQALEIDQRLSAAEPTNLEWLHDLSVSHDRMGDVYQEHGGLDAALDAYRQSLDIRKRLTDVDPSNVVWLRDFSISHDRLGEVLKKQENNEAARDMVRLVLGIREKLATADPSNAGWQRALSLTLYQLAMLEEELGDPAEALRRAEASLAIDEKLAALDPTHAIWQKDVKASRELVEHLRRG